MDKKEINKLIIKQVEVEKKKRRANLCTSKYISEKTNVDSSLHINLPNLQSATRYNPDTNGWCGYCCLAYGIGESQYTADRLGGAMRLLLLKTFLKKKEQIKEFLIKEDFESLEISLTLPPDASINWWMIVPDTIWLAVIALEVSIATVSPGENMLLYRYPDDTTRLPLFILEYIQDQQHFVAYRYTDCRDAEFNEHPQQSFFDSIFKKK